MLGVAATPHERLQMMASKSLRLSAGGKLELPLSMCPINSRGEGWEPQPAILRKGKGGHVQIHAHQRLCRGRALQLRPANACLLSLLFVPMDSRFACIVPP